MVWVSLDSTALTATAYLPAERLLYLRFRTGDIYQYFDVQKECYRDLLAADSKGRYFSCNIRDRFHFEKVLRSLGAG